MVSDEDFEPAIPLQVLQRYSLISVKKQGFHAVLLLERQAKQNHEGEA